LSITIATLRNLWLEKDTTLSRYQQVLKSERKHHTHTYDKLSNEVKQLKRSIDGQESTIHEKNKLVDELKSQIGELEKELRDASRVPSRVPSPEVDVKRTRN
jgi:chromosome segregation ATPase